MGKVIPTPSLRLLFEVPCSSNVDAIAVAAEVGVAMTVSDNLAKLWSLTTHDLIASRLLVNIIGNVRYLFYAKSLKAFVGIAGKSTLCIISKSLEIVDRFDLSERHILSVAMHEQREEVVSAGVDGIIRVHVLSKEKFWLEGRVQTRFHAEVARSWSLPGKSRCPCPFTTVTPQMVLKLLSSRRRGATLRRRGLRRLHL